MGGWVGGRETDLKSFLPLPLTSKGRDCDVIGGQACRHPCFSHTIEHRNSFLGPLSVRADGHYVVEHRDSRLEAACRRLVQQL